MPITPFACILLVIYIYLLLKKNSIKAIFISYVIILAVVTLNVRMGYFFRFGNSMMAYRAITTYITMIIALVLLSKYKKMPKKLFVATVLFVIAITINFFIAKFFPYQGQVNITNWVDYVLGERQYGYLSGNELEIGLYLVFICNCIILLAIKIALNRDEVFFIISKTIDFSIFSVILGLIEWVITNILHSTMITNATMVIFGTQGAQLDLLTQRGFLFTIQGITKEPSMFATVIFYLSILIIVESLLSKEVRKKRRKWLICCFLLLIMNPTLSSYIYLMIDIIIIYIINPSGKKRVYSFKTASRVVLIVLLMGFLVYFCSMNAHAWQASSNYLLHRFGNAFVQFENIISGSELLFSSEAIRLSGIVYDFKMWIQRPLFGFGLGSLASISGIITFLVGGGIICLMLYLNVLVKFSMCERKSISSIVIFAIGVFIMPNLLQNEYESIMCIVIPLVCYEYSLILLKNGVQTKV